jgi:hypothetical protein
MNDNNVLLKDKLDSNNNQNSVIILPSVVTTCLAPHDQCTGEFIDTTHSFRLKCLCQCGHNHNR